MWCLTKFVRSRRHTEVYNSRSATIFITSSIGMRGWAEAGFQVASTIFPNSVDKPLIFPCHKIFRISGCYASKRENCRTRCHLTSDNRNGLYRGLVSSWKTWRHLMYSISRSIAQTLWPSSSVVLSRRQILLLRRVRLCKIEEMECAGCRRKHYEVGSCSHFFPAQAAVSPRDLSLWNHNTAHRSKLGIYNSVRVRLYQKSRRWMDSIIPSTVLSHNYWRSAVVC